MNIAALILGVFALFVEQANPGPLISATVHVLDFSILFLIILSTRGEIRNAVYIKNYIRGNWASLLFLLAFTALFLYSKFLAFFMSDTAGLGSLAIVLRNVFLVIKVLSRIRKLFKLFERMAAKPAQTVIVSFALVILSGAVALMIGISTSDGQGLGFLDALFTATSAVCVTGLVVVDTATQLSRAGQAIVLVLIQIGGLGIMLFSFFVMVALRRRLSLKDRMTVSYMLSEDDMSGLSRSLRAIVLSTLGVEALGAIVLFIRFMLLEYQVSDALFFASFHAISAFCNAGFALFSDSLETFRMDPVVTLTIAFLIIAGGISFGVIRDVRSWLRSIMVRLSRRGSRRLHVLSQNSRVVLAITAMLLVSGFILFYLLEHEGVMTEYGLGEQYLGAFFQSVTLRTAGFNSVPFGTLRDATLLFMVLFMFIGGASGSTAGGIKINTLAAMGAYLGSFLRQEKNTRIGKLAVASEKIGRAFLILIFGLSAVFLGTFILSLSEEASFIKLLFETVSAFGTVGLSTGLTSSLSSVGKSTIILLMFLGRLGPLTILTAASRKEPQGAVEYPQGDLAIG
jgi:trk system potassium uptake protein TrkH